VGVLVGKRGFYQKWGYEAWCQWLMPVILATWQTEIKKIIVRSQIRQIVLKTLCRGME
jgi:hypothetical protein